MAVTTAAGKGTLDWAISAEICTNFTPAMIATITTTTPIMISIGRHSRRLRGLSGWGGGAAAVLTSAMGFLAVSVIQLS
ncbi:hypothetical protein PFUM301598_14520 [Pseudomonas fluorescens]